MLQLFASSQPDLVMVLGDAYYLHVWADSMFWNKFNKIEWIQN